MSEKPEIGILRAFHDLHIHFDVSDGICRTLESQLSADDQGRIEQFINAFRIEDWFQWIFSAMPWVRLIHNLDQRQSSERSKRKYQVPGFLLLSETSSLEVQPLLVEVKRVTNDKQSLKLLDTRVALCENYAARLGIPLVYAVYWEQSSAWTLNTPDTFESKSSVRKLPMAVAFELDCSAILGDTFHLVPSSLVRVSRFNTWDVSDTRPRHEKYGGCVSDVAVLGDRRVEMTTLESAAVDSMMTMKREREMNLGNGETVLIERPDSLYMLKLSSWITRHLALLKAQPTEELAHTSAAAIMEFVKKLDCPLLHLFPSGGSQQLQRLDQLFRTAKETNGTDSGRHGQIVAERRLLGL
jgi:hypothetical protein